MSVGFVDPASCFGVVDECFGVDALGGEHGDRGDVGAEAGAVSTSTPGGTICQRTGGLVFGLVDYSDAYSQQYTATSHAGRLLESRRARIEGNRRNTTSALNPVALQPTSMARMPRPMRKRLPNPYNRYCHARIWKR